MHVLIRARLQKDTFDGFRISFIGLKTPLFPVYVHMDAQSTE